MHCYGDAGASGRKRQHKESRSGASESAVWQSLITSFVHSLMDRLIFRRRISRFLFLPQLFVALRSKACVESRRTNTQTIRDARVLYTMVRCPPPNPSLDKRIVADVLLTQQLFSPTKTRQSLLQNTGFSFEPENYTLFTVSYRQLSSITVVCLEQGFYMFFQSLFTPTQFQ